MAKSGITWGIVPAHIESNDPRSYRLARRNGVLILQGAFQWQHGLDGGFTWRDIPTVELEGAMSSVEPSPPANVEDFYFEFVISDADYCTQAGGTAPTYAQALSEGQRYLAQYQEDGPHTLELRRIEVLHPGVLPLPIPQQEEL